MKRQAYVVTVTILTPWTPAEMKLALGVLPGIDDVLIIGSKSMRNRLGVDVMEAFKNKLEMVDRKSGMSPEEVTQAAIVSREDELGKLPILRLGPVTVSLSDKQTAEHRQALTETRDDIQEALIARGPAIFMKPGEEREARIEALQRALETAMLAGMALETVRRLGSLVLETRVGAFRRALTGELAANVEPLRIQLKPGASLDRVKARPRQIAPERMVCLESQVQQLVATGMVQRNLHAKCSSVAMAVPKGRGYRLVADYRAANAQVELVPWPMPDLTAMSS